MVLGRPCTRALIVILSKKDFINKLTVLLGDKLKFMTNAKVKDETLC